MKTFFCVVRDLLIWLGVLAAVVVGVMKCTEMVIRLEGCKITAYKGEECR